MSFSPAHPRSRGENAYVTGPDNLCSGSSPLTRGKLDRPEPPAPGTRLIPAHAGKTRQGGGRRARGAGLSPLTRGKLVDLDRQRGRLRLIPAHAGKTVSVPNLSLKGTAHPRSRGENIDGFVSGIKSAGSSPLTRGKRPGSYQGGGLARLIPAHAGKTSTLYPRSARARAHPRSRGENYATKRNLSRPSGSSPLTRGKHHVDSPAHYLVRLIPAHAGKTPARRRSGQESPAHPRSRGENDQYVRMNGR